MCQQSQVKIYVSHLGTVVILLGTAVMKTGGHDVIRCTIITYMNIDKLKFTILGDLPQKIISVR